MATTMPSLCLWTTDEFVDLLQRESEIFGLKMSQLIRDGIERELSDSDPLGTQPGEVSQHVRGRRFRVHVPDDMLALANKAAEHEGLTLNAWVEIVTTIHCLALHNEAIEASEETTRYHRTCRAELATRMDALPKGWARSSRRAPRAVASAQQ